LFCWQTYNNPKRRVDPVIVIVYVFCRLLSNLASFDKSSLKMSHFLAPFYMITDSTFSAFSFERFQPGADQLKVLEWLGRKYPE